MECKWNSADLQTANFLLAVSNFPVRRKWISSVDTSTTPGSFPETTLITCASSVDLLSQCPKRINQNRANVGAVRAPSDPPSAGNCWRGIKCKQARAMQKNQTAKRATKDTGPSCRDQWNGGGTANKTTDRPERCSLVLNHSGFF